MSVQSYSIRQNLTVDTRLTSARGLVAYRCRLEDENAPTRAWEGLCSIGDMPNPRNFEPLLGEDSDWGLLPLSCLNEVIEHGYDGKTGECRYWSQVSPKPYTDLHSEVFRLVRRDSKARMLFDSLGEPFPLPQKFQVYRSGRYDMRKLYEHLRSHEHAVNVGHDQDWDARPDEFFDVSFTWAPDLLTYRRAWEWCLKLHDQNPKQPPESFFFIAVEELGLLGLRKAGCLK